MGDLSPRMYGPECDRSCDRQALLQLLASPVVVPLLLLRDGSDLVGKSDGRDKESPPFVTSSASFNKLISSSGHNQ